VEVEPRRLGLPEHPLTIRVPPGAPAVGLKALRVSPQALSEMLKRR
jgi:hypothetical protein